MTSKVSRHDLMDYSRRLEEIVSRDDTSKDHKSRKVIDIMKVLASLEVDPLLVRNAQLIVTVNGLHRHIEDEEVIQLSRELLRSWKSLLVTELNEIRDQLINGCSDGHSKTSSARRKQKYINEYKRRLSADTNNENRLKSREMIARALMTDRPVRDDILKMADIAIQIEKHIFAEFKDTESKYKNRVRSRVANLSDECRVDLRDQILKGEISTSEIAKMTSEEMASDRLKKLRQKFTEETMAENILPEVYGTTSDLLRCPECKKNTCTYNQVQIERADEPMTTFCLCISCGHRWRFN